jgi:hypothetical protein
LDPGLVNEDPPQKFRETQHEWFGKRDISMHVDSIFMLIDDNLAKVTFLTLIDRTKQDAFLHFPTCPEKTFATCFEEKIKYF